MVYLYKQGIPLPKNSVELYIYFIFLTVYHHLTYHGLHPRISVNELIKVPKLTDLPEPCNKVILGLSRLSLEALNDNKLVFTLDEIKSVCPDITDIPGAINGFGLLQAIEHFGLIGTTTTFNFLHLSIQEYLAAHHLSNLPDDEELKIIQDKFWSQSHLNMFTMYLALTQGQRPPFKQFLCDGSKQNVISNKFLGDHLQCLWLYSCFYEAGDSGICKAIEQSTTFTSRKINLSSTCTTLTTSDVEHVAVFITSSFHKEWAELCLSNCYIQDHGLHMLHRGLLHCDVIINKLQLSNNGLTKQSSSLISDITMQYKVRKLVISCNYSVGENQQLYYMLTDAINNYA